MRTINKFGITAGIVLFASSHSYGCAAHDDMHARRARMVDNFYISGNIGGAFPTDKWHNIDYDNKADKSLVYGALTPDIIYKRGSN